MKPDVNQMWDIVKGSLKLIRQNPLMYLIPLVYLSVAGFILTIVAVSGFTIIAGSALASFSSVGNYMDFLTLLLSGTGAAAVFFIVLFLIYISGYVGGMGQMLIGSLKSGKTSLSEFFAGVFRHGPRLFFGLVFYTILVLLPIWWSIVKILNMYGIYDFATMDSGWNSQLRDALGSAHTGVLLSAKLMQIAIVYLLGFWWVISIHKRRSFIAGFIKSIIFVIRKPVESLITLTGTFISVGIFCAALSLLLQYIGILFPTGLIIALYLIFPAIFLVLLQVYDTEIIPKPAPEQKPYVEFTPISEIRTGNLT